MVSVKICDTEHGFTYLAGFLTKWVSLLDTTPVFTIFGSVLFLFLLRVFHTTTGNVSDRPLLHTPTLEYSYDCNMCYWGSK